MLVIDFLDEMNNPTNMKRIIAKLPFKLKEKWRSTAFEFHERNNCRAKFEQLVHFIERQAKMVSDPLFGDIQDPTPKKDIKGFKPSSFAKAKSTPTYHGSSFATVTTSEVSAKTQPLNQDKPVAVVPKPCLVCNEDHAIESCQEIIKKPNKERVEILKKKGICFGCLIRRHMSKGCRRQTCSVCSQRLPSILHIQRNEAEKFKKENVKESDKTSVGSGLVSLATHGLESSDQHCTLPIVPVQVKLSNSNHIIQTYAFLDQGSSATFCTDKLRKRLNAKGKRNRILLRTMGQNKPVNSLVLMAWKCVAWMGINSSGCQRCTPKRKSLPQRTIS